jgi:hypothetical protein
MLTYIMSIKIAVSCTADSLRRAIQLGTAVLKQNPDGKSDCWRKFRLIETAEGEPIFVWAACVDFSTWLLLKMKGEEGTVKLYGTKNLKDHSKTCSTATGKKRPWKDSSNVCQVCV